MNEAIRALIEKYRSIDQDRRRYLIEDFLDGDPDGVVKEAEVASYDEARTDYAFDAWDNLVELLDELGKLIDNHLERPHWHDDDETTITGEQPPVSAAMVSIGEATQIARDLNPQPQPQSSYGLAVVDGYRLAHELGQIQ